LLSMCAFYFFASTIDSQWAHPLRLSDAIEFAIIIHAAALGRDRAAPALWQRSLIDSATRARNEITFAHKSARKSLRGGCGGDRRRLYLGLDCAHSTRQRDMTTHDRTFLRQPPQLRLLLVDAGGAARRHVDTRGHRCRSVLSLGQQVYYMRAQSHT
jgi:hypothetical protein